jgi:2-(1,2-epoxy-1,2-dihydrophenyl)acetyl-CoA isomerase
MLKDLTTLDFEVRERVATIRLNRPEAANGFNLVMASELAVVAQHCDMSKEVKAVLLSANGRFFSAGGDLKAMANSGPDIALEVKRMADELHRAISTFQRMKAPLVVAVNGTCAGAGFSLAITGDVVIAATSAKFTMAYTSVGLSPDGSSTYFLPRLVGLRKAQELMFTNRTLSSKEALDWGLISAVFEDLSLRAAAADIASKLAHGSLAAHGAVKELLMTTFANPLETQMELEGRRIAAAAASSDGKEGIEAFVQKRLPQFG